MKHFNIKMGRKLYIFALLGSLVTIPGCSSLTVGHNFDINTFTLNIKTGETTKAQVRSWLGEPLSSGISVDKKGVSSEEWMYFYGSGNLPKMDKTKVKILQIRFDKNGRISTYNWSRSKE